MEKTGILISIFKANILNNCLETSKNDEFFFHLHIAI